MFRGLDAMTEIGGKSDHRTKTAWATDRAVVRSSTTVGAADKDDDNGDE
jgi:hypothetical protein